MGYQRESEREGREKIPRSYQVVGNKIFGNKNCQKCLWKNLKVKEIKILTNKTHFTCKGNAFVYKA